MWRNKWCPGSREFGDGRGKKRVRTGDYDEKVTVSEEEQEIRL
jgi:hypothetical protein